MTRMQVQSGLCGERRFGRSGGSALILVIVLTVLLSIIGIVFVMMARIDEMATLAVAGNRNLEDGVQTVVSRIKAVLVDDLFGFTRTAGLADGTAGNEAYDFPGAAADAWLASLEPFLWDDGGTPLIPADDTYQWRHITDLYGNNFNVPPGPPITPAGPYYDPDDDTDITQWDGTPTSAAYLVSADNVLAKIIKPDERIRTILLNAPDWTIPNTWLGGARADADGDGVADSRWVKLPNVSGSKGEDIFAAVRIIDNCAMLNLNTVHRIKPTSDGRYLSAVDYERFLRGSDRSTPDNLRLARNPSGPPFDSIAEYHENVIMNIEDPCSLRYVLFDIGDELEIRNRYLLTSLTEARFERRDRPGYPGVLNLTLDAGGSLYGVHRIPYNSSTFADWKIRMNRLNFGDPLPAGSDPANPEPFYYDRRHVCTFYSFDRNLRSGKYPLIGTLPDRDIFMPPIGFPVDITKDISSNTFESRENILHLLYAFRAFFYIEHYPTENYKQAARRAVQVVANMIDFSDDTVPTAEGPFFGAIYGSQTNQNPTFIDRAVIRELVLEISGSILGVGNEIDIDVPPGDSYDLGLGVDDPAETVYGYERQPFISELYCDYNNKVPGGVVSFSVELCNPYTAPDIDLTGWRIKTNTGIHNFAAGTSIVGASSPAPAGYGRWVEDIPLTEFGLDVPIDSDDVVELQRPDPATGGFLTVDRTEMAQSVFLLTSGFVNEYSSKRDDNNWGFANAGSYINDTNPTLNAENGISTTEEGFQLPVPDDNMDFALLADFKKVLFAGNMPDPNSAPITTQIASAFKPTGNGEADVRFDAQAQGDLFGYICFLNRPQGNLPGRININTATKEVIRAAIPPDPNWLPDADALAANIVDYRNISGPFKSIGDLLNVSGFDQFETDAADNVGDPEMGADFEERDWILARVANIFTVRSDVFTAYILVRLGEDGPQKRMIAIFDRSNVFSPDDKPRLIALHPVPDPR